MNSKDKLSCYAVDDEPSALSTLEIFIKRTEWLRYKGGERNALKAKEILSNPDNIPDIVFLDIEMPRSNGFEIAQLLMGKSMIVFTTGHRSFAADSYAYNAVDYLLKPFSYEDFLRAVEKCRVWKKAGRLLQKEQEGRVIIKDSMSAEFISIYPAEVMYVNGYGNYSKIILSNGEYKMPLMPISKVAGYLPDNFLRIHKSYIVNLDKIRSYERRKGLTLSDDTILPVGRTFRTALAAALKKIIRD